MNDYIEVTVRVPADLKVGLCEYGLIDLSTAKHCEYFNPAHPESDWCASVLHQIAAAIESRKPRPPKFQVGDVVEWRWHDDGVTYAGAIREAVTLPAGGYFYWIHGMVSKVMESDLTLVRRAAK